MFKRLTGIVIIVSLATRIMAAGTCEFEKDETDKFTQQKNRITKPRTVAESLKMKDSGLKVKDISFKAVSNGGEVSLYIMVTTTNGSSPFIMGSGATLTLLTDNKQVITLSATGMMDDFIERGLGYYQGRYFSISNADLEKINGHGITDIRVKAQVNGFDTAIPYENQWVINELIQCLK